MVVKPAYIASNRRIEARHGKWLKKVFSSASSTGYPKLLAHEGHIFVSWLTKQEGHHLIEVK
ncbi:hypothetical protein [Bathymodiolus platifrons methanotrophic gill symbiont]|uniref:hypothetical protein n=1 Tax=Bathymodiolus platifrons methanotrophic gill symbiont TaxID=113268 RepID=UPI001124E02B|nr:hypothetical protein [Bathymodiolus platifrons methanotrophic gill symbiont]